MNTYLPTHVHSEYSLLDSIATVRDLAEQAKKLGLPGVAFSDHGNLSGAYQQWKVCNEVGIKPVIGCEFYFAPEGADVRESVVWGETDEGKNAPGRYTHMCLFALNAEGLRNLFRLQAMAYECGFYYKPRIDMDMLREVNAGIAATTGCMGGVLATRVRLGQISEANQHLSELKAIFGDRLYAEVMDHGVPGEEKMNDVIITLAEEMNVPLLHTLDCHYVEEGQADTHGAFLCQPPGTLVTTVSDYSGQVTQDIAIEDIKPGMKVVSLDYLPPGHHAIRKSGREVLSIAEREHFGDLVRVTAGGRTSRYTPEHIAIVNLNSPLSDGGHVVYLMRNGTNYRIGQTSWIRGQGSKRQVKVFGPASRLYMEGAEDIWVLKAFHTEAEAREYEALVSWRFNIPTWGFGVGRNPMRQNFYPKLWNRVGNNGERANECLKSHGRDIRFPLLTKESAAGGAFLRAREVRACNLMDGMTVCVPTGQSRNVPLTGESWLPLSVEREEYSGKVYSLEVDGDKTYLADGIMTHNCIQTGATLQSEKRFSFSGSGYHLRSYDEMVERNLPISALANTLVLADRVESYDEVFQGPLMMPRYTEGDQAEALAEQAYLGMAVRLDDDEWFHDDKHVEYIRRLEFELGVINDMNYPGYFLVMADVLREAHAQGIVTGPARGSAGGSLVAYALNITQLDPIAHGLLFERFLNPQRKSLPDIDLDVAEHQRQDLLDIVREKYGETHVVGIGTYGRIGAKAALKDSTKVLGGTFQEGTEYTMFLPKAKFGRSPGLDEYTGPKNEVYDLAVQIEGLIRSQGQHAAGIIISPVDMRDQVPLWKQGGKGAWVCGFDMHELEAMKMIKFDFLGLSNLDVIDTTLGIIHDQAA